MIRLWQTDSFDFVLMDVQMTEMDGLEATGKIRELETVDEERTIIIALTAHAMKRDQECCLTAGMDGYLSKPIKPRTLFETIESFLPPDKDSPPPTN